jgi:phage FluMu protein Com
MKTKSEVIRCASCSKRLGVPKGLHIIFTCPACNVKQELFFTKVSTLIKQEVDNNNFNTDIQNMEFCKNKKHHYFLNILN